VSATNGEYELVGGMIAAESPQRAADRVLELLERGEIDRVRDLIEARAAKTAEAIAHELAAAEQAF
jgi:hypothetical protein